MKIKSKILILSLALAAILTGCGEIEDETAAAGKTQEFVGTSVTDSNEGGEIQQKADAQEGEAAQTVVDPRQAPKTQQTTEAPQVTETAAPVTEVPETTAEPIVQSGDILTPGNIDNYQFGFELFSDGHKNCWDQRYDCAKVMLEAISQPDTAEKMVDLTVTVEQLNEKESSGFMTWLKFEEPMSFQVGDTVVSGSTLNIIDYDGSYYFFIGEIEEMNGMFVFDSDYIPKILEAAGCGG